MISTEEGFKNKMELIRWFDEDEIPEEEQREIEIQMVEDYANKLRGRAKFFLKLLRLIFKDSALALNRFRPDTTA